MASHDKLKALIDQLLEARLETVRGMLEHHVYSRPRVLKIKRVKRRFRDYKKRVTQRLRKTRKARTIRSMGESIAGILEGAPFERHSFEYWDEKALVHHPPQSFDGHEIKIVEQLSLSSDRRKICYVLELSSGDRRVRHMEEFSITEAKARR